MIPLWASFEKCLLISSNAGPSQIAGKLCHKNFFSTSWQNDQTPMAMGEVLNQRGVKSLYVIAPNYAAGKNKVDTTACKRRQAAFSHRGAAFATEHRLCRRVLEPPWDG